MIKESFLEKILPGNYSITKSMEISSIKSSGTLWYMKKWIVLYYYIFISRDDSNRNRPCSNYMEEVCKQFDLFIESLPQNTQEEAKKFFYPEGIYTNLKDSDVKTILDFAPEINNASKTYYQTAKRAYFCVLMNVGGQRGLKALIRECLSVHGYNEEKIRGEVIKRIPSLLASGNVSKTDVLKVITEEGYDRIKKYKKRTEGMIGKSIGKYIKPTFSVQSLVREFDAPLRNQRQLMFYYGFFYSQSLGNTDTAFSSLTDVGEYAYRANWSELLVLWEHQKIKMISQTPVTVIQNLSSVFTNDASCFSISYSPYLDILKTLCKYGKMTKDEYKYVVARMNGLSRSDEFELFLDELLKSVEEISTKVQEISRPGDNDDEDFAKVSKMFMLGIESDFSKDDGSNYLGFVERENGFRVTDSDKGEFISGIYKIVEHYKMERYGELFSDIESDIRDKYVNAVSVQGDVDISQGLIKSRWFVYNNHIDTFILLTTALVFLLCKKQQYKIEEIQMECIVEEFKHNFPLMLKVINEKASKKNIRVLIENVLHSLEEKQFEFFLTDYEMFQGQKLKEYDSMELTGLEEQIDIESAKCKVAILERKRNMKLVELVKIYHEKNQSEAKVTCECCGKELFITRSSRHYSEVHHIVPFSEFDGPDHYLNLICLCPNCHRMMHYLPINEEMSDMYRNIEVNSRIKKTIKERYATLFEMGMIKAQSLGFLVDNMAITQAEYDEITEQW